MLPAQPPGEDDEGTAGPSVFGQGGKANPIPFGNPGTPPGEDGNEKADAETEKELISKASSADLPDEKDDDKIDFLAKYRDAETQAMLYNIQNNRRSWTQNYRAVHNQHFEGAKYTQKDYRYRSRLFRPKTRSALKKDNAAVAASLFGSLDAIKVSAGDESNPRQVAGASLLQELINYRTDRPTTRVSIPWFHVAMGARQDSYITGVCVSKQSWKLEQKRVRKQTITRPHAETGEPEEVEQHVYRTIFDRPEVQLIPPECAIIAPTADWTNPAQSAPYLIIKWPMTVDEIKTKQDSPRDPWIKVDDAILRQSVETVKFETAAIRRAREMGLDRFDHTQTGYDFQVVWVSETFMRIGDEDYTFFSIGDKAYLTDPRPVEEVYPEQAGERPIAIGYGALESHRIYPMSPVAGVQPLQHELNDLVNLALDAIKQNVMPVSKVVRGRQIDLDQVKRRASGSSILVNKPDDITWDRPPDIPQSVPIMTRNLELEFDDSAGQFNAGTTENNNALSRTLGGLKLVAGSANAVQEYDIRIWIQTWVEVVLAQLVHLEQFYENDAVVLGLCGQRAQLFQKHGISKIDDDLLEQEVTTQVSAGLGAGDPQQRLAKFQSAASVVVPLLQQSPEFQRGELEMNTKEITKEVFSAAGYKDGGERFFQKGQGKQDPMGDLPMQKLKSEIDKNTKQGKASLMQGLAALAKVELGSKELEASQADSLIDMSLRAHDMGTGHAMAHHDQHLSAVDHGHRHGLAIAGHRATVARDQAAQAAQAAGNGGGGRVGSGQRNGASPSASLNGAGQTPPEDIGAPAPQQQPQQGQGMAGQTVMFIRDPRSGRIIGARFVPQAAAGAGQPPMQEPAPMPPGGMGAAA